MKESIEMQRVPHLWKIAGNNPKQSRVLAGALIVFLTGFSNTLGQQTVFNVPSADVLDGGKVYAELDVSFKPSDSEVATKFSSFVPRVVFGVGKDVEVGLNLTGNVQPGRDSTTLVPAVKWKFYNGKDNGWSMLGGTHVFIPLRNRTYDAGNYSYLQFSKTFKGGTRLTAGGYAFTTHVVADAARGGGQFAFEQPLTPKVSVAADWFTGKHSAGYFTPGVIFKVGPRITGYASYSIGNQNVSRDNHFFLLEFGYNFN